MHHYDLWDDLRSLAAEFRTHMVSFAAIHGCLFDREWLTTHPGPVDYGGHVSELTAISAALEGLCAEAARMAAQPESLTTFRDYFAALLPLLDASRACVNGLRAYCASMNDLARGGAGSVAEAQRLRDLYVGLGIRMNSARNASRAARARWGL